tara:strand:+ start:445 stop:642 length:198 start_codon:yes stop_codon:yes gene_type:complete
MSIKKEDMKSIDELVQELSKINESLFAINNNIAQLVLVYQMQLMTSEEFKQLADPDSDTPKKKFH